MDIYWAYQIETKDDFVIALLSDSGFESFVEEEDCTIAYISEEHHNEGQKQKILQILQQFEVKFTVEEILPQNWNELWENSFSPVAVEGFCLVRADFHPKDNRYKYDLIINPKMAFGTGHHATTFMMLTMMKDISFQNKNVFDYGAGTGILAILASKMNAKSIDALDIEKESYFNISENAGINKTPNIKAIHGTLQDINLKSQYDIILANINRNILLESAEFLVNILVTGGIILLSGILKEDIKMVIEKYNSLNMNHQITIEENNWACVKFTKPEI